MNVTFIDDFLIKIRLHHCSVLSPLLFMVVSETLSHYFIICREIRFGCIEEIFHAYGLALFTETFREPERETLRVKTKG